jgi:tetratricopeptide (TPR) repeat protein
VIVSQRLAEMPRANALCRELLEGPKSPTGPYLRVALTCALYGLDEIASALAEKGAAVIKLPSERCRLHEYRQIRHKMAGDYAAAVAESERSVAAAKEANNLRLLAQAQTNLGDTLKELGAYAQASATLKDAIQTAERIGYDQMAHVARHNLGLTRAREGAVEEGLAILRAATGAFQHQGDRRMSAMSNGYLAMILFDAGDVAGAERYARMGVDAASALPSMRPVVTALLARILAASGRAREALPLARDAVAYLDAGGRVEEGESLIRLAYIETLVTLGDPSARAAIVDTRRLLLERASRIGDPDYRRVFLQFIPEHARTTELYVWQNTAADSGGT